MGTPTLEEMYEYRRKHAAENEAKNKEYERELHEAWLRDMKRHGLDPTKREDATKKHFDHPSTMENGTATFFWIVTMVVGAIFKGNWIIWIVATTIWLKFITRHKK